MRCCYFKVMLPMVVVLTNLTSGESSAADRAANTIILDKVGVKNLGIETEAVDFVLVDPLLHGRTGDGCDPCRP